MRACRLHIEGLSWTVNAAIVATAAVLSVDMTLASSFALFVGPASGLLKPLELMVVMLNLFAEQEQTSVLGSCPSWV